MRSSNTSWIQDLRLRLPRSIKHEPPGQVVHLHDTARLPARMSPQDRLHRLYRRHRGAVGAQVGVGELPDALQALAAAIGCSSPLDEGDLLEESADDLDPVAALAALVPGFEELPVVMMVRSVLE